LAKEFSKDPNAGGDSALNEMFQKLYADATEDQRRAMIKSYQESNGTSLSTNWEEVSKVRLDGKTFPATHTHLILRGTGQGRDFASRIDGRQKVSLSGHAPRYSFSAETDESARPPRRWGV
jgi:hypothetical protein